MTQRDRIVIGVVALAVVLGGFWFVGLKPNMAKGKRLEAAAAKQVQLRDAALARAAEGENARRRYAEDYATVAKLGKAVPVNDQTPSLVYGLEKVADRHGVDFRLLRVNATGAAPAPAPAPADPKTGVAATQAAAAVAPPGSSVGAAGFPTLPFTFGFDGTFFGMERFLSSVEKFTSTTSEGRDVRVRGRLLTIDAVSLTASRDGFPKVKASIAATAYVLPPGENLTAGATPAGPATAATGTAAQAPAAAPKPSSTTATVRGVTP